MNRHRALILLLALLPSTGFGPPERPAPDRWALVVGVGDYLHFVDEPGGDLPGASRDARVMRDVLVRKWGFAEERVRLLLDGDATRSAIEEGLSAWLRQEVRPGDHVTFFFAGHGSQVWDLDGDEDDGLDETIAPADVLPDRADNDIVDDELRRWLAALPTDDVVVYLDSCHSGTGTRDVTPFARTRRLGRDVGRLEGAPGPARRAAGGEPRDRTGADLGGAALELAAAQPHQAAVEAYFPGGEGTESFHGGAFTTFLVRELWRAPAGVSYEEAFRRVREALKRNRFEQDPYLSEGASLATAPLFSFGAGASGGGRTPRAGAEAVLPVLGVDGEIVELGGGGSLGITPGSLFRTDAGARLLVRTVTAERAVARTVEGSVTEGDRARLAAHRFGGVALRVNVGEIGGLAARALEDALGEAGAVTLVQDPAAYSDLLLRRSGDSVRVVGLDGATRARFRAGGPGSEDLARHLRKEAAAKRLGDMQNPVRPFEVEVGLQEDRRRLRTGETVTFTARSERDGYLTLVDLGTDGTVTVLFPNPHERGSRVRAGEPYTFPSPAMDFEIQVEPPPGRGMVRAFVTDRRPELPLGDDFTSGEIALADRIAGAVSEAAGSDPDAPGAVRLDTWGTASVVYEIER